MRARRSSGRCSPSTLDLHISVKGISTIDRPTYCCAGIRGKCPCHPKIQRVIVRDLEVHAWLNASIKAFNPRVLRLHGVDVGTIGKSRRGTRQWKLPHLIHDVSHERTLRRLHCGLILCRTVHHDGIHDDLVSQAASRTREARLKERDEVERNLVSKSQRVLRLHDVLLRECVENEAWKGLDIPSILEREVRYSRLEPNERLKALEQRSEGGYILPHVQGQFRLRRTQRRDEHLRRRCHHSHRNRVALRNWLWSATGVGVDIEVEFIAGEIVAYERPIEHPPPRRAFCRRDSELEIVARRYSDDDAYITGIQGRPELVNHVDDDHSISSICGHVIARGRCPGADKWSATPPRVGLRPPYRERIVPRLGEIDDVIVSEVRVVHGRQDSRPLGEVGHANTTTMVLRRYELDPVLQGAGPLREGLGDERDGRVPEPEGSSCHATLLDVYHSGRDRDPSKGRPRGLIPIPIKEGNDALSRDDVRKSHRIHGRQPEDCGIYRHFILRVLSELEAQVLSRCVGHGTKVPRPEVVHVRQL